MTNKDLNLALDKGYIQPATPSGTLTEEYAPQPETPKNSPPKTPESPYKPVPAQPTPTKPRWLSAPLSRLEWGIITIVLLNLLFVIIAGFWLFTKENQPNTTKVVSVVTPETPSKILLDELDARLEPLNEKLAQLQLVLNEQQRLIASSSHSLDKQLQAISLQVSNTTKTASKTEAKTVTKTSAPPISKKNWYVNVGTFSSKEAALKLQKQIQALGHKVQINAATVGSKTAFRVQLPGFKDRESAEGTARQLMNKTNLNGLWAWKDE